MKDEPLISSSSIGDQNNNSLPEHTNSRGTISFASGGPNTRTSQLFINLVDNKYLDKENFTPIGRIIYGALSRNKNNINSKYDMNIIDMIYDGYGEGGKNDGSDGKGPSQGWLKKQEPNKFHVILQKFPKMS